MILLSIIWRGPRARKYQRRISGKMGLRKRCLWASRLLLGFTWKPYTWRLLRDGKWGAPHKRAPGRSRTKTLEHSIKKSLVSKPRLVTELFRNTQPDFPQLPYNRETWLFCVYFWFIFASCSGLCNTILSCRVVMPSCTSNLTIPDACEHAIMHTVISLACKSSVTIDFDATTKKT